MPLGAAAYRALTERGRQHKLALTQSWPSAGALPLPQVLEPAWARFMGALGQAADLDAVIALHDDTLEAITKVGRMSGWCMCCNGLCAD